MRFRTLSRKHLFFAARDVDGPQAIITDISPRFDGGYLNDSSGELMSEATNDLPQVRLYLDRALNAVNTTWLRYDDTADADDLTKAHLCYLMVYPPSLWLMQGWVSNSWHEGSTKEMGKIVVCSGKPAGSHVIRSSVSKASVR